MAFPKKAVSLPTQYEEFASLQPDYEGSERLFQEWKASQIKETCSCVSLSRSLTGFNKSIGYAKNWPINSERPEIGGVVVTNESSSNSYLTGHVAYITEVFEDGTFKVIEANYVRCKITSRILSVNNKKIIGFWKP